MSYEPTVAKDFYLVRDLCAVTCLGKATVYEAIEKGELPGYKAGNRYVVPGEAFRAFCEGRWVPIWMRLREDNRIEENAGKPVEERKPLVVDIRDFGHAV